MANSTMEKSVTGYATALVVMLAVASAGDAQVWEMRNFRIEPTLHASHGMNFGDVVVVGDFNGDGRDDLAIAGPEGEGNGGEENSGNVVVHLGSAAGLSPVAGFDRVGTQADQSFGTGLAAGDFNGDGRDELAVGSPLWDVGALVNAGKVDIFGLEGGNWVPLQTWTQDTAGVHGTAETGDHFGAALATGDFDGDGRDELVIGAPNEDIGDIDKAGAFHVFRGSSGGLEVTNDSIWWRGTGLQGEPETGARLGYAFATGDFNGDGTDDLAIGSPGGKTLASGYVDGSVSVLYGYDAVGLVINWQQTFDREVLGELTAMNNEFESAFGATLAAADLDPGPACVASANCPDDLIVGAPFAAVNGWTIADDAGAVYTIFGDSQFNGLWLGSASGVWQNLSVDDSPAYRQYFGLGLAAGKIGPARQAGIVVAAPYGSYDSYYDVGVAIVAPNLRPGAPREDNPEAQLFAPRLGLATGPTEPDLYFGSGVAIGDFDGDGAGDVAIGVPAYPLSPFLVSGAVQILYGGLFNDGFESGGKAKWSN